MRRPTHFEFAAGVAAGTFTVGLAVLQTRHPTLQPADFIAYRAALTGDLSGFYYPPWALWLVAGFAALPQAIGVLLWNLANLAGVIFAGRVFGGSLGWALLSYPLFFSLYYGQIAGLVLAGLAGYALALAAGRPLIAGAGAALALVKPQLALPFLLVLAWRGTDSWRDRILSAVPVLLVLLLSLALHGNWPLHTLQRIQQQPPIQVGSLALWRIVGPAAALLWLPVLLRAPALRPMPALIAIAATSALALPYYQLTGLVGLLILPIGWPAALGLSGYLMVVLGWRGLWALALLPALCLIRSLRE